MDWVSGTGSQKIPCVYLCVLPSSESIGESACPPPICPGLDSRAVLQCPPRLPDLHPGLASESRMTLISKNKECSQIPPYVAEISSVCSGTRCSAHSIRSDQSTHNTRVPERDSIEKQ